MKLGTFIAIMLVLLLLVGGAIFYFFFFDARTGGSSMSSSTATTNFWPFNRGSSSTNIPTTTPTSTSIIGTPIYSTSTGPIIPITPSRLPALRMLSATPVGGYGASTTATTTIMRWVDRGRGNIYEAYGNSLEIKTLSTTMVPRIYESIWTKGLNSFIAFVLPENSQSPMVIFTELRKIPLAKTGTSTTSTSSTPTDSIALAPFELKGQNLPENTYAVVLSPNKTKIFILVKNEVGSIGYIANIDGSRLTELFKSPITQLQAEWPVDNTIAINTNGSILHDGYLYFVDVNTGSWKKILGPLRGLSTRVSNDGKKVILSIPTRTGGVVTNIYDIEKNTGTDTTLNTLADKCVWGNFYKDLVYCGVPFQPVSGIYPDDWYRGVLSTTDKIWQINASTEETRLVSSLINESSALIDVYNMKLDDKDNYLLFTNKNNLSLWSLDLVRSN